MWPFRLEMLEMHPSEVELTGLEELKKWVPGSFMPFLELNDCEYLD